jgi:hypothetical protein
MYFFKVTTFKATGLGTIEETFKNDKKTSLTLSVNKLIYKLKL